MPTPEQEVKNQFCSWMALQMRRLGILDFWFNYSTGVYDPVRKIYRKRNSRFDKTGVSDVIGILSDGRWLALEFKTDTVKNLLGEVISRKSYPSPEQRGFLELVNSSGGVGMVIRSMWDRAELETRLLKRMEAKDEHVDKV